MRVGGQRNNRPIKKRKETVNNFRIDDFKPRETEKKKGRDQYKKNIHNSI